MRYFGEAEPELCDEVDLSGFIANFWQCFIAVGIKGINMENCTGLFTLEKKEKSSSYSHDRFNKGNIKRWISPNSIIPGRKPRKWQEMKTDL